MGLFLTVLCESNRSACVSLHQGEVRGMAEVTGINPGASKLLTTSVLLCLSLSLSLCVSCTCAYTQTPGR